VEVTVSGRARSYILNRGGELYVWVDSHGLVHADTGPLTVSDDWTSVNVDWVRLFVAPPTLATKWHVRLSWLPWSRLVVTSDGLDRTAAAF
jgi:hypothetical protein